ncbi:MAG: hypothetical protein WCQ53_04965 [bacterium]
MSEIRLTENDFAELYQILDTPVTDFDCGAVCAKSNEGVPICCEVNVVIPVLYINEYEYVKRHSCLWQDFIPDMKTDKHLMDDCGYDDVMAICKGHKKCERKYRSFVCRTFPFYPFIDESGSFLGLTYNYDFEDKCVLVGKHDIISKHYIKQFLEAWNYMFHKDESEFEAHYNLCRDIEKSRKRKGKPLHIINLEGVIEI